MGFQIRGSEGMENGEDSHVQDRLKKRGKNECLTDTFLIFKVKC